MSTYSTYGVGAHTLNASTDSVKVGAHTLKASTFSVKGEPTP